MVGQSVAIALVGAGLHLDGSHAPVSLKRDEVGAGPMPHPAAQINQDRVVYKKRMLFCIFSCTNSVRQFILSAWLLKLLIVGTVEVKISLNLARRPTINSATAAMIVVNKAAKTPQ